MERGAFNNLFLAHGQLWGFMVMMGALIWFTWIILTGHAKLDPTSEKLAYTVLGVFLAKFGDMAAYLYNRQRPDTPTVFTPPQLVPGTSAATLEELQPHPTSQSRSTPQ